jgi:predicted DsbA family dithiol-disulfide isomerase
MSATLEIDFVSDVACPWCAVGLNALERAIARLPDVAVELRFQPFELNPQMPPEGEDSMEHLSRKYGMSREQLLQGREAIRARGAAVGFAFGERTRIWNTFDAHRLLHWAAVEGPAGFQRELKHALLEAYHGRGQNPGSAEVLLAVVAALGADAGRARAILAGDEFAAEVRAGERHWQELGIHAVPSVVVNGRHLIQGGQPPEVFEQALRQIAAAAD